VTDLQNSAQKAQKLRRSDLEESVFGGLRA
jgi:hypothetical protein